MGIYKFSPDDAEGFARHIKMRYRVRGNQLELMFCPYCKTTSDKWTFGINTETGQFECKRATCGSKGNMITLSRDFNFSLGREADAYYRTADYSAKQYKTFRDAHRKIEVRTPAVEYLAERGISADITERYEITTAADKDNILVFPFKDESGNLTFVKYRNTQFKKGETNGSKEWCEANCKPILFGMNHCDPEADDGQLIITEGQIDSLSVAHAGYKNAVSVPTGCNGFTWIPYCWDFVSKFKSIVVMGDCENGRITLANEISKRWKQKVKICRSEDYRGCKDANEILQKHGVYAIREAISKAKLQYNSHIKPLAKVKQVDIMNIELIKTEIEGLDNVLDGGFRLGQLVVLTGKRGEGKSTIASMFGIRAIEQGYKCFFYSGELPDFYFRNWMDCQVTGKFEHTESEHDKLDKYYGDKAFIFDETQTDGEELPSLLSAIEMAVIQNGCKFIMLDNLMTALADDLNSDLYRSQSKFVGDLTRLAKKYEVLILLIAHPRKMQGFSQNITNDDISGSSNITDKADIVLTYGRGSDDPDPNHRLLSVTKNRLTGRLCGGDKAIGLIYDKNSRRLAENHAAMLRIHFKWNDDPYEFEDAENEVIPF